ncbi:MAG: hypothetical protein IJT08_01765 [Alphaproteobacteria bacterium]|nr:hypothetical protein [Alphaproteobacteria bacterium]
MAACVQVFKSLHLIYQFKGQINHNFRISNTCYLQRIVE